LQAFSRLGAFSGWKPEEVLSNVADVFGGNPQQELPQSRGQRIAQLDPRIPFVEAAKSMQGGNQIAGTLKALEGVATVPFNAVGLAAEGYRSLPAPLNVLAVPFDAAAVIPAAAAGVTDFAARALDYVVPSNRAVADVTGIPQGAIDETANALGGLNRALAAYVAPAAIARGVAGVRPSARASQIKHQTKAGAVAGAGESLPEMRRAGSFAAEFNVPLGKTSSSGGNLVATGAEQARAIVRDLDVALNEKIIKPATESGQFIDGNSVLRAYEDMRAEYLNAVTPKRSALATLDRMIADTKSRLSRSTVPGRLTPVEAQELKVLNNKYLEDFYRSVERKGGSLNPIEKIEKQVLARGTRELREQLESLDPQVRDINWTEGAGLELANAIESYAKARLKRDPSLTRGAGITAAAAGRPSGAGLFAATELMLFRPFRYAYHKAMSKAMGKVAGSPREFMRPGEVRPYTAPPDATRPPRGLLPPGPIPLPSGPDPSRVWSTPAEYAVPEGVQAKPTTGTSMRLRGDDFPEFPPLPQPKPKAVEVPKPQYAPSAEPATPRAIGMDAVRRHTDLFPTMSRIGKIRPEWVIDAKTGKVKMADEYLVFDRQHLDMKRPSLEAVKARGGKIEGSADLTAQELGFADIEALRSAYQSEYNLFTQLWNDPQMAAEQYGVVSAPRKPVASQGFDMKDVPFGLLPFLAMQMVGDRK
jgi:hypothetical protein